MIRKMERGRVATIGFFDGVHRGHRFLIDTVRRVAAERGMDSLIVTFAEHPRSVLQSDYVPELLTSPEEKTALLVESGVDRVEMMHFSEQLSRLTAKQFMQDVLRAEYDVRVLVMGYDHQFGHGGGTLSQYEAWGAETGIEIIKAEAMPDTYVSSSECRRLLGDGDVDGAASLLGHPYVLRGRVVPGHHVGHELGFPTANLQPHRHKLIPCRGVYAVYAVLDDGHTFKGMLNIGERPTIDNSTNVTIEVNLIDFDGNIYGRDVTLRFVSYIRKEARFSSRQELVDQIRRDRARVLSLL